MADFNWTCPHCDRDVTITDERLTSQWHTNNIKNAFGRHTLVSKFIICPNPQCKKYTLSCALFESHYKSGENLDKEIQRWNLIPPSSAKSFPDFIPQQILSDYFEACLIRDLSPKASATLARRCLQGIIRDYWAVKPGKLFDEIEAIKDKIDPLTWDAIDAVRKVGNIGAHMEKDINLIVDVEPHEAELLINLIETLFKDWYVTREERRARLLAISGIAEQKDSQRKGNISNC
ncbi:MAG: DUF4145 domain-containing protein [Betaproteobacteria bacterium]|nr:DUF4145 domain-containing protein [Betaproteobacteria bacterium]